MFVLNVKIDMNNFSLWQIKMQALLKQQGFWAPLSKDKIAVVTLEMASEGKGALDDHAVSRG